MLQMRKMGTIDKISSSTVFKAYRILEPKDRLKLRLVIAVQVLLGLLDLVGVALFGVLGSLAVNGVSAKTPGNRVQTVLRFLHVDGFQLQTQVSLLALMAVSLLAARTLISALFIRRALVFLSRRAAVLTEDITSKLLARDLLFINQRSTQETVYALTTGAGTVTLGVLGTSVSIISDTALLLILSIGLFIVDPVVALSTYFIFGFVAYILYRLMHQRSRRLGAEFARLSIQSSEKILEVLAAYRELTVKNRRNYYSREIAKLRFSVADTTAELQFQPYISKYVIESTLIIGTLVLAATQFSLQDSARAVGTLAVFMAAATRIAPAVLRLQQGAISIKGSIGMAGETFNLISELENSVPLTATDDEISFDHSDFYALVELSDVYFKYPVKSEFEIKKINLRVNPGEVIAVVGKSGSGKTTIIDLVLGILKPESGAIRVSGKDPIQAVTNWPGAISYVPQNVAIINASIRQNVALGFPESIKNDSQIWEVLRIAQLEDFVRGLPGKLDSVVGEFGTRMSGGQRQRLGIARALFTNPKLLILDEATSALDGLTESELSSEINSLKGTTTVVIIAHRMSTISSADRIYYVENGAITLEGSYQFLVENVADFGG